MTAAMRYELADHHTFDFVEASLPCPMAPEIQPFFTADDQYFKYFDLDSAESIREALSDLERYVAEEGPFDGVLGFSLGGALAAMLLITKFRGNREPNPHPPFKCAIFLSAAIPYDPTAILQGEIRKMGSTEGELIPIPTAHIWGSNDNLAEETCPVLSELCNPHVRNIFVHDLGHDVPGARSHGAMNGTIRAIRRTIDQCESSKRSGKIHYRLTEKVSER